MLGPKTIEMYNKLILRFLDKVVLILAMEFSNTTGCYVIFGLLKFLSLFLYVLPLLFFTFSMKKPYTFLLQTQRFVAHPRPHFSHVLVAQQHL